MLDVDKLVVLRAVIAEGSIAAAGRRLGYTRSAVSQQMSALERSVGQPLFVRGTPLSVTPTGRRLLEHTERVLTELRAAEAAVRVPAAELTGTIRIGVPFHEGPPVMSSALTGVRRRHPGLRIVLASTAKADGPEQVRSGRLDVVILSRYGDPDHSPLPGLHEWTLGQDPLQLCVAADHPLRDADGVEVSELAAEPWVLTATGGLSALSRGLCAAAGFEPSVVAEVDDVGTALGLVAVGWGVTVAPALAPSARAGAVRRIPLTGVAVHRRSVLVVRDGEQDSPEVAAVASAVREVSRGVGYS